MATVRLTKAMQKDQARVQAWMDGMPFQENSRDKHPSVPELTEEQVMAQFVPEDITAYARFYTPRSMAFAFWSNIASEIHATHPLVLDPCAGIGCLLQPFYEATQEDYNLEAWEVDDKAAYIGMRLFPQINWTITSAYSLWKKRRGLYDAVVMNPPFSIYVNGTVAEEMSRFKVKISHYAFFEMAMDLVKPGGIIGVIAPWSFDENMPSKLRTWSRTYVSSVAKLGKLPGEFRFTGITVEGLVYYRNEVELYKPDPANIASLLSESKKPSAATITGDDPLAVVIPYDVYNEFAKVQLQPSHKAMRQQLTKAGLSLAAEWLASHFDEYGVAYWHGFKEAPF